MVRQHRSHSTIKCCYRKHNKPGHSIYHSPSALSHRRESLAVFVLLLRGEWLHLLQCLTRRQVASHFHLLSRLTRGRGGGCRPSPPTRLIGVPTTGLPAVILLIILADFNNLPQILYTLYYIVYITIILMARYGATACISISIEGTDSAMHNIDPRLSYSKFSS